MLIDQEFIKQLEIKIFDTKYFKHIGHLRLFWICLNQYEFGRHVLWLVAVLVLMHNILERQKKYNATVTYTLMRIIEKQIKKQDSKTFEEFLENNLNIVDNAVLLCANISLKKNCLVTKQERH